jgi:hypothetical protein
MMNADSDTGIVIGTGDNIVEQLRDTTSIVNSFGSIRTSE